MPEAGLERFLVVSVGSGARVALPAARVRSVAPVPALTRVPGASAALAGLAATRNGALPVLDLARLLAPEAAPTPAGRMVLAEADAPVGLLVGGVAGLTADPGAAPVLDLPALVAGCRPRRTALTPGAVERPGGSPTPARPPVALLMLTVAGSPYALPLDMVEEVVALPAMVAPVPEGGPATLGAMPWRGRVLPLLSVSALLGRERAAGSRAAVVRGVGLVAERIGPVLRLPAEAIDPVPRAWPRGGAAAGFARFDGGRILVCILSAQALIREGEPDPGHQPRVPVRTESVLALDLAGERYGLPADAVRAAVPAPETLVRVPGARDGLAGLATLRGRALPVLDLRRRLGLPSAPATGRRRLLVIEADGARAGLLVDGTARLIRPEAGAIRPAPPGTGNGLVARVAALPDGTLSLIDPAALLARPPRSMAPEGRPA
ncbi:chemotaxis protein CheW [Methylobacterium terricola]|uniref:Chemotaxis protein CheW n=1 Tax=Methylobacterium terricola TaxID=2583531 RepID=A0A5C4LCZ5_9HYPH|nr:chemotaxis protein CheW [Methylobacterium terricola]TNC09373.1 chemotaxis protein CheW [Methylobacterium terricola]